MYKEYREKGIGSAFMEELKKIYSDMNIIIVEGEKPEEAKSYDEKIIREK